MQKPTAMVKKYAVKLFMLISTALLLVTLGSFFYILFYNLVIPDISFKGPLNFLFKECGSKRCNHPSAFVDIEDPNFQFNFKRGEQYEFIVDLLVPESPVNHDVGMFVLSIEFEGQHQLKKNENRVVFRKEKKSTMLRYKSRLLRLLSSLLYSPFLVYGIIEETQKISTKVVSNYEEKPEFALKSLSVILESHRLNIYEAHLTVQAKLEGFRYFMYHYPIVSFFIGYPVFLIPVIATFFSVTSNTFEKKKKRLADLIYRTLLSVDFGPEEVEVKEIENEKSVTEYVKKEQKEIDYEMPTPGSIKEDCDVSCETKLVSEGVDVCSETSKESLNLEKTPMEIKDESTEKVLEENHPKSFDGKEKLNNVQNVLERVRENLNKMEEVIPNVTTDA